MGAWGFGPFQSDAGLDGLDRAAASGDAPAAVADMLAGGDAYESRWDADEAWAAIGLVVFAADADTNLPGRPTFDDFYASLLTAGQASDLADAAAAACDRLTRTSDWLGAWLGGSDEALSLIQSARNSLTGLNAAN